MCQDMLKESGTCGTGLGSGGGLGRRWVRAALRLFCVAGVARGDICLRFVWQAWHLATSTSVLCGRRGTHGTGLGSGGGLGRRWVRVALRLFCVAGVALGDIPFVLCGRRGTWRHPHSFCWAGVALTALGWVWWRPCRRWVRVAPRLFFVAGVALNGTGLACAVFAEFGSCVKHCNIAVFSHVGYDTDKKEYVSHVRTYDSILTVTFIAES
eukprot:s645_g8.t1